MLSKQQKNASIKTHTQREREREGVRIYYDYIY